MQWVDVCGATGCSTVKVSTAEQREHGDRYQPSAFHIGGYLCHLEPPRYNVIIGRSMEPPAPARRAWDTSGFYFLTF
jgi:hypothetical protein